MAKQVIFTESLMRPIAHFSHASRMGNLVHIGATAGVFPGLRLAGESPGTLDVVAQTHKMFENLETTLGLMGAKISDVVRLKTYVISPRDIGKYSEIYRQRFSKIRPAHTIVASWDFPLPQAAIELDAVAVIGGEAKTPDSKELARIEAAAVAGVMVGNTHYATTQPVGVDGNITSQACEGQAHAALTNLEKMLSAANLSPRDICNLHVSISDIRDVGVATAVLRKYFGENLPSLTMVGAPLERVDFRITIESVAVKGGGQRIGSRLRPLEKHLPAPAVLAGDILYLSGATAAEGSVEQQTRQIWQSHFDVMEAAGFAPDTLIRSNNILVDWRDYAGFNSGYGANVAEPYVPRATVLGQLADPVCRVQIEGIAHRAGADATILQVAPLAPRPI